MPSLEAQVWTDLTTVVTATWPELLAPPLRAAFFAREGLLEAIQAGTRIPPLAVLEERSTERDDWGLGAEAYRLQVDVTYVVSRTDSRAALTGGGFDAVALVVERLAALRDAVVAASASFQVVAAWPTLDVGADSPLAAALAAAQFDLMAGRLRLSLLYGTVLSN